MQISQNNRVIEHLRKGKGITHDEAYKKYGIARLAARINYLRNMGYNIKTDIVFNGKKKYAKYWLIVGDVPQKIVKKIKKNITESENFKEISPHQELQEWRNSALRVGTHLNTFIPKNYYEINAKQWMDWAIELISAQRIEIINIIKTINNPNISDELIEKIYGKKQSDSIEFSRVIMNAIKKEFNHD